LAGVPIVDAAGRVDAVTDDEAPEAGPADTALVAVTE
jgi:hypothetical protein